MLNNKQKGKQIVNRKLEVAAVITCYQNSRTQSGDCYYGSDIHKQYQVRRNVSNNRAHYFRNSDRTSPCSLRRKIVCNLCEPEGHILKFCPHVVCYVCQSKGHIACYCNRYQVGNSTNESRDSLKKFLS